MEQAYTNEERFCRYCGIDISIICPTCHGLGYIQQLPTVQSVISFFCNHADERGEYCSKCGAKLQIQPEIMTCGTCMGKGWVTSPNHYCLKQLGFSTRL